MSSEERILYFNGIRARLCYDETGAIEMLRLEFEGDKLIVIRSRSVPDAPEKIYEFLRECEIEL